MPKTLKNNTKIIFGDNIIYSLDDEHILNLFNQGMEHIGHD